MSKSKTKSKQKEEKFVLFSMDDLEKLDKKDDSNKAINS